MERRPYRAARRDASPHHGRGALVAAAAKMAAPHDGEVINRRGSYQQAPAPSQKKAEGKKRKSPCTPFREKAKGKESKPGAFGTCLFAGAGARVRGALLRRHVNAAVEDALKAFCGTRGPAPSDEALWAKFAWRFGYEKLTDLVRQGVSEMSVPGRHVAPAERPKVLQNLLNEVWNARFPKAEATGVSLPRGADNRGSGALAASSRAKGGAA